jgi:hypothetical protein
MTRRQYPFQSIGSQALIAGVSRVIGAGTAHSPPPPAARNPLSGARVE